VQPANSPSLCSRPRSEHFPISVFSGFWPADSPTPVSDSPAALPRTVRLLGPGVHRECCFPPLIRVFVSIVSQGFFYVPKTSSGISCYRLARVFQGFGVSLFWGCVLSRGPKFREKFEALIQPLWSPFPVLHQISWFLCLSQL
jgi:hypothetical protein